MKVFSRLIRKSYVTLLETLIAIFLLSILLMFVFGFFRELSQLTLLAENAEKESFQMRYLETRLGYIFERIVNENSPDRYFFFYSQPPQEFSNSTSLIFTFNNDVRADPTFSGDVLARLYIDLNHRLCLMIWPMHVSQPHQYIQEEVLADNVVKIKYEFYSPPERMGGKNDTTSQKIDSNSPEKDKWHEDSWLLVYDQMPSIIKMTLSFAKNPEDLTKGLGIDANIETTEKVYQRVYHFVLPSSKNYIYFPSD